MRIGWHTLVARGNEATNVDIRAVTTLTLMLLASSATAQVFKCEDADGNVMFTDRPCAKVSTEVVIASDGLSDKARNVSVEARPVRKKRMSAFEVASEAKAQERKRACGQDRSSKRCDGSP